MKKIATTLFFSCKVPLPKKRTLRFVAAIPFILLVPAGMYGQQVIGSFPSMDGGFQGQAVTGLTLPIGAANYTANTIYATFNRNNNDNNSDVPPKPTCAFIRATGGNSSPKCLSWTNSSTSAEIFSPTASSGAIQPNTSYVVQFFAKKDSSDRTRSFDVRVSINGNSFSSAVTTSQSSTLSYKMFTAVVTTPNTATGTGYIGIKPKGGGFYNSFTPCNYLLDDVCMYAGSAVDNVAPDEVISPSVSAAGTTLNLTWTAPATGIDGGGYMVIRYASNPVSEPAPIANGIYAVGNTVGSGTIVSLGTATNFSNIGLTANTAYYYRIYVVDKAFNYSPTPVTVAGYTGTAIQTGITFTTPATCLTDRITISWTGPLNYSVANNTQLAFLKQGSAVNAGTPTNNPSTYTENTLFGSGTAYQNDAAAYCIYNGDGTDAAGDHSGLTITGLLPNTTYYLLIYNVIDAPLSFSAGSTGNGTTLINTGEPLNNATAFAKGVVTTSNIPLTWAAATGTPAPIGYLIKASNSGAPVDAATTPGDFIDIADQTSISGGTANAKVTGTSYSSFTGFTAGTMYYFRNSAYTNSNACINYKAAGSTINVATLPNVVSAPAMDISAGVGTINWTAGADYSNANNTTLVFVSSNAITVNTPTVNPAGYIGMTAFGAGTAYQWHGNARCVYNGDGTSANVTGLIAGSTYYVLILTVVTAANSDATYSYSAYTTINATYNNANEYIWRGGANGLWTTATNWNPDRNTPSAIDVLIFNTAGSVVATNVPTETIAKLVIDAGNVVLQPSATNTLTITSNNVAGALDLTIDNAASLTLDTLAATTSYLTLTLSASTTANILGTLTVNGAVTKSVYNTNAASAITTVPGTVNCYGTVTSTLASRFVVTNGGVYNHGVNGGIIPTGTWNTNSTCLITGSTTTQNFSGHKQTFSKFVWDCPNQSHFFVLGENSSNTAPKMVITDSFIVRNTGGTNDPSNLLQITSSGGQSSFTCGNYFQYGGMVAITYNTDGGGLERSLIVNNTFYVTDSLVSNIKFQIINNPGGTNDINGRLYVKGNLEMHVTNTAAALDATKGANNPSVAELWFNGNTPQYAKFSTITGNVDFVTNHTSTGVTLGNNVTANKFKLMAGTFFINGNTLTIKDSVTYPSPGAGTIGGSSTSNLTLNGIAGSLSFYNGYRILKNLTLTSNATTGLGTELSITAGAAPGVVTLASGAVLTCNDNLILRSDANGTARIAPIPTSGGVALATINDKVQVERYLPMNTTYDSRRWRLVTAPFKNNTAAPTINAGWQEGAVCPDRFDPNPYNPRPGYGTHITKSTAAGDGFDQGVRANPSIFYYNNATNGWVVPANTNSVKLTDNTGVYLLFARGDRSIIIIDQFVNAVPTTLAPKGELNTGDVTKPQLGSGFQTIGNPYASAIKLDNVAFNDTLGKRKFVYIWDPKIGGQAGVGGFITCQGDNNPGPPYSYTYAGSPVSSYSSNPGVIESSGAFMTRVNGGNTVFHETDKTTTSTTIGIASRPAPDNSGKNSFGKLRKLYTDLFIMKKDEGAVIMDGVALVYNHNYSNSIDDMDAPKINVLSNRERLSIKQSELLLSIERRTDVNTEDTVQLNTERLKEGEFQFGFRAEQFDDNYKAFLKDKFKGTLTPINLERNNSYSFSITSDVASAAADRFMILFRKKAIVRSITANAEQYNNNIVVDWKNNGNIFKASYIVERSSDGGKNFIELTEQKVSAGTLLSFTDENPAPGNYQYRIRTADDDGIIFYSNIAAVEKLSIKALPSVYPNPVRNGQINLHMGLIPQGNYTVQLLANNGQLIHQQVINHQNSLATKVINVKNKVAKGNYKLEIFNATKKVTAINILVQ